jgi:hypothetical protein
MGTGNLDTNAVGTVEVYTGGSWVDLGYISDVTWRINGNEIPHINVQSYPIGRDIMMKGRVDIEAEVTWEEVTNYLTWQKVLHGGTATTTTAGTQAVTDEEAVLTGVYWVALKYWFDFQQTCTVTVSSAAAGGGVDYTEGTDYYLDRRNGHIKRISGGSISDGQTVYVDYTYVTYAGHYFLIFADTKPESYGIRITKPLLEGTSFRTTHDTATFSCEGEWTIDPGDTGELNNQVTTIKWLKDTSESPTYGVMGRWEVVTI